ncbi:hypothetical protein ES703_33140 [subsurface metagenome]
MKGTLKRFIKLSWKGIPIGIIATVLIGTAVLAAVLLSVTQTITQEIKPYVPPPPDYGSITADDIILDDFIIGDSSVSQSFPGAVTVVVKSDGVGKYLHLKLNSTSDLYEWCGVTLRSYVGDNPITGMNLLINVTYGELGGSPRDYPHCSVQLTEPGTYTFEQTVGAIPEGTLGTAEVKVDITLEDDPAEENTIPF